MKNKQLIIIFGMIIIIFLVAIIFAESDKPAVNNRTNMVGNDRDEHGCIGSAGYQWCEEKKKCLRIWEENCSDIPICTSIGTDKEAWTINGKNFYTKCSDCTPVCKGIGSKSEGWYAECGNTKQISLIEWDICGSINIDKCGDGVCDEDENQVLCVEPVANCHNESCAGGCHKVCKKDCSDNIKIKILPDTASQRARERLGELGFNITLKTVGNGSGERNYYEARAEKHGRFLGIFKVKANVTAEIDADTGEIKNIKKPWWGLFAGI